MKPVMTTLFFNKFFPPEVFSFISDSAQDFKLQGDQLALTGEQQKYCSRLAGFPLKDVFYNKQVHGKRVIIVRKNPFPMQILEEADAVVTDLKNIPIAVRTADCVSVFLYDPKRKVVGVVHAGWKGSKEGITGETLKVMQQQWGTAPRDVLAAFGPSIRPCCYEVGEEFYGYFPREVSKKDGKNFLDVPLHNKRQLLAAGVKEESIFDCTLCTFCDKKYFSYRRDGENAGRMISIIMLKG